MKLSKYYKNLYHCQSFNLSPYTIGCKIQIVSIFWNMYKALSYYVTDNENSWITK